MTIKVNYFDGEAYSAAQLVAPMAALLTSGVYNKVGGAGLVTEQSPAALAVNVAVLTATINGYFLSSDAITAVPITANSSGFNRIDIIVAEVDDVAETAAVKVVTGTPASSPAPPVATADQILLAQIAVGNGVSVINTANITDKRVPVGAKVNRETKLISYATNTSGVQTVTLGYRPRKVKIHAVIQAASTNAYESIGSFDGVIQKSIYKYGNGTSGF